MNMCKSLLLLLCISLTQGCCQTHGNKTILSKTEHPTMSNDTHLNGLETKDSSISSFYYEDEIILDSWLQLNISSDEIINKLGVPVRKGKTEENGNSGVLIQIWEYPQYGLYLLMDLNNPNHIVQLYGIEAVYPCKFKTARDIGIGSSLCALLQKYPKGKQSKENFSIGDPYGICMNFSITADTISRIAVYQDFD